MNFNKFNLFFLALDKFTGVPEIADISDRISVHPSAPGVIDSHPEGPAAMANRVADFVLQGEEKPLFLAALDI